MRPPAAGDVPYLPRGVRLKWCDVRGGWYLLAPERAVKLDAVAAAILGAADGERTVGEMVRHLSERYEAPAERIEKDVSAFLADLSGRRMLEVRR